MSEARGKRESNLIPNSERSPSELREMGRKGGIKSGESRRRNKRIREAAKVMAEVFLQSEEGRKLLQEMSGTFKQDISQSEDIGKDNM